MAGAALSALGCGGAEYAGALPCGDAAPALGATPDAGAPPFASLPSMVCSNP